MTSTGPAVLALRRSYTWGLDIAHTQREAGGVGALLQVTDHLSNRTYLASYDGNGNVAALSNAANGALAADRQRRGQRRLSLRRLIYHPSFKTPLACLDIIYLKQTSFHSDGQMTEMINF